MGSRRKSSVLLPFNATATRAGLSAHTSHLENVTYMRNKKTPAKRRRTQVEVSQPEIEDELLDMCEDMKGKLWNIYRVSDLNNFDYSRPSTFTRYGRLLSRRLVESFVETAITLKATLTSKPDIQGLEGEDPPVYIKVEDVQFEQPRVIYEGFLLSAYETEGAKVEGAVHLPVLLARGITAVRNKVHDCLAALFSSSIFPVPFPGEDMLWMIASWVGFINASKTSKEVVFLYSVPSTTDTIKCQYQVNFIKSLWHCIHDERSRVVELNEVKRFHSSLVNHTKSIIGLNLAAVPLVMFKTPDFELHAAGKIKVKTADFIPRILHFIAGLCETRRQSYLNPA